MSRRELEAKLRALGWTFLRHVGAHDVWSRDQRILAIPRHNEINETTARRILRNAE